MAQSNKEFNNMINRMRESSGLRESNNLNDINNYFGGMDNNTIGNDFFHNQFEPTVHVHEEFGITTYTVVSWDGKKRKKISSLRGYNKESISKILEDIKNEFRRDIIPIQSDYHNLLPYAMTPNTKTPDSIKDIKPILPIKKNYVKQEIQEIPKHESEKKSFIKRLFK